MSVDNPKAEPNFIEGRGIVIALETVQSITFNSKLQTIDINGAAAVVGEVNAMPMVIRLTREATGGLVASIKEALDSGKIRLAERAAYPLQ